MGTTKKGIDFSERHTNLSKATRNALQKVSEKLIADTKKDGSYIIVSDENGAIKKIPAKDL